MKLLCAEYNTEGKMTIGVVGDNALLRNNNDFYFPVFTQELSCVPQLVCRACKLGKGVSERFSRRYYEAIGVGLRFYADTLERNLQEQGLPSGLSASFDDSAAISELFNYAGETIKYALQIDEQVVFEGNIKELPVAVDRFIARASEYYMIKIGDFFFCGNPFRYRGVQLNSRIRMYMNDICRMDFYVR